MGEARVHVRHFTDPGCPFGFSAEPERLKLRWLFGDQLEWETRMIVLAEDPKEYEEKNFTPAKQARSLRKLQQAHGMPIDSTERPRMAATEPACRAVVATRLHEPAKEEALLRRLRVRTMDGELLDEPTTVDGAATDISLDFGQLRKWMDEDETKSELQEDMRIARLPIEAAQALDHKLADAEDGRRYTCPTYEFSLVGDPRGDDSVVVPDFQPFAAYDVALANLASDLERREAPQSVTEVLEWADCPLATAEIAAIAGIDLDQARTELSRVAQEQPAGADGYWTLP
ncbi:MAG: DsbA family oxidoreductase [Solirubrobacteraceae bacterium]